MNNVFVYIELENGVPADVSLELLTKGRELATTLGVKLEAVVLGHNLGDIAQELAKYGADTVWTADDKAFAPFRTLPHTAVMCGLIEQFPTMIQPAESTSVLPEWIRMPRKCGTSCRYGIFFLYLGLY